MYNRIITEFERPFCQISQILSDDEQNGLFLFSEKGGRTDERKTDNCSLSCKIQKSYTQNTKKWEFSLQRVKNN